MSNSLFERCVIPLARKPCSAHEIFLSKTLVPKGECLLYPMKPDAYGYGQINVQGKVVKAHRVAWECANDKGVPGDMYVDHICHEPACCNPAHLRLATPGQNMENRKGATRRSTTGYRGVINDKSRGKFQARVSHRGKSYFCGRFDTSHEAAEAARRKRMELHTHNVVDRSVCDVIEENSKV